MLDAFGWGIAGKKRKKSTRTRKHSARMLERYPHPPRLNFDAGNCSRRNRLARMQLIQVMYEVTSPVAETDRTMLNAAADYMSSER
jgi:hypothetical protein